MLFFEDNKTSPVISILSRVDLLLIFTILLLAGIGMVVQFSTSGQDPEHVWQQLFRIVIALVIMLVLANVPMAKLEKYTPHVYTFGIILLLLVDLVGADRGGAQRWLDLKLVSLQPSELMKLMVPMMVAWVLSPTHSRTDRQHWSYLVAGILVLVPVFFVYYQPDLGTALLIAAGGLYAIYLGGIAWRWLGMIGLAILSSIPILWPFLHEYQRARVISMFDPWQDPTGVGYHSIQSMIAIGSGGTSGKGWLNGSQTQLEFIPERNTDFVFSVFAEEFGFVGAIILLLLFSFLIYRCFTIAYQLKNHYARIVVGSIVIMIFVHVFVNIGMVSGILPVVGIPLPIISFGGSSIITVIAGIGIVMGARHETE